MTVSVTPGRAAAGKVSRGRISSGGGIRSCGERGGAERGHAAAVQRPHTERSGPAVKGHASRRYARGGGHGGGQSYAGAVCGIGRGAQFGRGRRRSHRQLAGTQWLRCSWPVVRRLQKAQLDSCRHCWLVFAVVAKLSVKLSLPTAPLTVPLKAGLAAP